MNENQLVEALQEFIDIASAIDDKPLVVDGCTLPSFMREVLLEAATGLIENDSIRIYATKTYPN